MENIYIHPNSAMNQLDDLFKIDCVLVYEIKNKANNRKYYGITRDIERRIKNHISSLKHKKHTSTEMQNDFNKWGMASFSISVVDIAFSRKQASEIETELIKSDDRCYNVMVNEKSRRRNDIINYRWNRRERAKKQGKHLGRPSQPEKEVKRALKLYQERETNGMSVSDIVKATGVPRSTIYYKAKTLKK